MGPWFPVVEHCNEVLQASAHYIAHPSLLCLELYMCWTDTGLFLLSKMLLSFEGKCIQVKSTDGTSLELSGMVQICLLIPYLCKISVATHQLNFLDFNEILLSLT